MAGGDRMENSRALRKRSTPIPAPKEHLLPLTPAERAKRYRQRMNKNPMYKEKEKMRKKIAWRQRTSQQIERDKENNRIYQQRYRDQQKNNGIVSQSSKESKVLTRKEREKRREYWRQKQKESRAKRHGQKVRRKREKDRNYKREKRLIVKLKKLKSQTGEEKRMKRKLVSQALLQTLKEKDLVRSQVAKRLSRQFKKMNKYTSTCLGISPSYFCKIAQKDVNQPRKKRKDKTSDSTIDIVESFFRRGDVSTNLPNAKRIKKDLIERRVLDRPLNQTYSEFKELHPEEDISFPTFTRYKPKNVETTSKRKWNACLCDICTNVDLKIRALNHLAVKCQSTVKVDNKYEALNHTMCPKVADTRWHKKECIQRECTNCGVDGIVRFFQPLVEANMDVKVTYTKWGLTKLLRKGNEVTHMMPRSYEESPTAVVVELSSELQTLAQHVFVANWQQNQASLLLKSPPPDWTVLNMDFAENYSCVMQEEVQSAHWGHSQVTIHPTVAYYRCPKEECGEIIQEALIFVTDDGQHDAHAVAEFVNLANKHLQEKRGLTISKEIQLTDGCASQYKSKIPFTDVSYAEDDFSFPIERHFYGSRHGKGPSDGAGGVSSQQQGEV